MSSIAATPLTVRSRQLRQRDMRVAGVEAIDPRVTLALRTPSVPFTMLRIALVKALLRIRGFAPTCRWIAARVRDVRVECEPGAESVRRVEYAVAMAAALYPGRAQCLERSLVLYWYLRSHALHACFRMGVQRYPFLAHAWVEWRGQVLNDVAEHVQRFQPIEGLDL